MTGIWARLLQQPVLVGLWAAALLLFGLAAALTLPIRSSPIIPTQLVDISTNFPGADAATIDRFVTLPLESAAASISGVSYVTGSSQVDASDIQAWLAPGAAPDIVFARLLGAVNGARANFPAGVRASNLRPVGDDNANQELNITVLFPPSLDIGTVTAYTTTNLIPRFETVPGIGPVYLYTGNPSLRFQLDPARLAALSVTPLQVANALTNASTVDPAGVLRSSAAMMPVQTDNVDSAAAIDALPVATRNGVTITLGQVGHAQTAFDPGADLQYFNDKPCLYIAAGIAPSGNIIEVAARVRQMVKDLNPSLPPGVSLLVTYDQSIGVSRSLHDLAITLIITILLVACIVRLSLGTLRATAAPVAAIALSLLGATIVMQLTGQTFNLFTIIALVLAVGLVVDDAIVVVEDIFRRVAEGETPLLAAQASVTRLAPLLAAISSTLVVAFLPLGFLSGLTAALFRPFALVLISAFLFSLALALTVVPYMAMWASRTYKHRERASVIDKMRNLYLRLLAPALRWNALIAAGVLATASVCGWLAFIAPKNLDPAPDGLDVSIFAAAPNGASMGYLSTQLAAMEKILHATFPGQPEWMDASEQNHALFGGYSFDTPEAASAAVTTLTAALANLTGLSAYVSQDSGLPGSEDLPISINISGQISAKNLLNIATTMQAAAYASGKFNFVQINPGAPQYQYALRINRPLAAQLGVTDADIGATAAAALSGGTLGQVNVDGNTLNLTAGLPADSGPATLAALPIATSTGHTIPLGTVATLTGAETPNALGSWQGLPSVNIQAQQANNVPISAALDELRKDFRATNPQNLTFGYSGPSETYQESNRENQKLFELGLAGLFFLLAAQFRSLRDPFVVITTVPLASLGPLILFNLGGATLNIVTEIALLTVWGLIARQGILFVQVAHEGLGTMPIREAALRAARNRFRPILMITLALIGGAIPLILSTGPQATIRYDLGIVLLTGMSSGFLLSLIAVPAMYCLFHRGKYAQ
jgi:multidrug efflux pump